MKQRGRRSADEISVVRPDFQRPAPPKELTADQRDLWKRIVATKPADWFASDTQPLLSAYCRHITTWRYLATWIDNWEEIARDKDLNLKDLDRVLAMREREARAALALARAMRLTQQAQYRAETASTAHDPAGDGPKPWHDERISND